MIPRSLAIAIVACSVSGAPAVAEEFRAWKSTSGHPTRALFHELDENTRTVTLLVPRTISLDDLDGDSRRRAMVLHERSKIVVESEQSEAEASAKKTSFRYTKSFVWGVGDFRWFEPSVEIPDGPDERKALLQRYNVEQIPRHKRVEVVKRRKHPVSGNWIYLVKYLGKDHWVLEGDLSATPP